MSWRPWALLAGILAALAVCLGYAAVDAVRTWRAAPPRRRRAFLAAALLAGGAAVFLTRGVEPRAGRHNEHALSFLASSAFVDADLRVFFEEREASPRVLLSVYELAAGRSLRGVRAFQLLVWLATAFFIFAALWRGGAGAAGAAAGALLYLLNFHSVLLAHGFAPDLACILILAAAVYAVVRLATEADPRRAAHAAVAVGAASFLAFTAKFEFGAVVLAGGALALASSKAKLPRAKAAAGLVLLAAMYGLFLTIGDRPENKLLPSEWFGLGAVAKHLAGNLYFQLVTANLGETFGVAPSPAAALAVIAAALAAAFVLKSSEAEPSRFFWPAFLSGWIVLIGALYLPMSFYPASHSRHHLFVFLPFVYLAGVLAGRVRGGAVSLLLALFLSAYADASAGRVRAYRGELRTGDRELSFLLDSRRDWPAGCRAIDPLPGLRPELLRKYFPYWDGAGTPPECLLVYRSPRSGPAYGPRSGEDLVMDGLRLPAWREASFAHAWYTDWHGPWDWSQAELLAPVPVVIGFYRADAAAWSALNARLKAASAPRHPGEESMMTAAWLKDVYHPLDPAYERSAEFCYKSALARTYGGWSRKAPAGPPADAAACFKPGPDVGASIEAEASRALYLQGLGRETEARAAAAAARALGSKAGYKGWALLRAEFAEQALARSPSRGYPKTTR